MISLYESNIELSVPALFESLKTRYKCDEHELDANSWNDFAKSVNMPEVSEPISRKTAYAYLNKFLENGMESIQKLCDFFDWNDIKTVETDLIKAERTLVDAIEYPDIIDKFIKRSDMITKIVLKNNWYIAIVYNNDNDIEKIHISVEDSVHKTESGLHDLAEVGFYKDKICVNLDSHKEYNDNNGYNNLYDMYIMNKDYDFSKYKSIAEQIISLN